MQHVLQPTLHRLDASQCYMGLLPERGTLSSLSDGENMGTHITPAWSVVAQIKVNMVNFNF